MLPKVLLSLAGFTVLTGFSAIDKVEKQGLVVELGVENAIDAGEKYYAGDLARFRFYAHDTTSEAPLSGAYPAAWVHPRPETLEGEEEQSCRQKTQQFIGSSLFSKAQLDLNTYYVLTLNDDATISVVDPLFGFGGSKLLTVLPLPAPAYDWTKLSSQEALFVSVPATNQVLKINTASWTIESLGGGGQSATDVEDDLWHMPTQLTLQKDQNFLWAAVEEGVAVFNTGLDAANFALAKQFSIKGPVTEITFSGDGRYAFVLSAGDEMLHIIDVLDMSIIKTIKTARQPVSMDYSALAEVLYITHAGDGSVMVVDGKVHKVIKQFDTEPGVGMVRFTPDGRWGLIINPATDRLLIVDASQHRVMQSNEVEDQPDQISFTDELAYIRHRGSSTILMLTLDDRDFGKDGKRISAVDTPGGDYAPGLNAMPTPASGIVQAPGSNAVLIANFYDKAVYFYKEGAAAPMGQFSVQGRSPRAVMAIDHSLREYRERGVYETVGKLPQEPGLYDVIYFMDTPRIVHCFTLLLEADQKVLQALAENAQRDLPIVALDAEKELTVGEESHLRFKDSRLKNSRRNQTDSYYDQAVRIIISHTSGMWRQRQNARFDDKGNIALTFTPPLSGYYQIAMDAEGVRISANRSDLIYFAK